MNTILYYIVAGIIYTGMIYHMYLIRRINSCSTYRTVPQKIMEKRKIFVRKDSDSELSFWKRNTPPLKSWEKMGMTMHADGYLFTHHDLLETIAKQLEDGTCYEIVLKKIN